jgi:hypothetical protein
MLDLYSRATPVVLELGGEGHAKKILAHGADGPTSIHAYPHTRYSQLLPSQLAS